MYLLALAGFHPALFSDLPVPADGTSPDIGTYLFGYGPVGIGLAVFAWLLFRGYRLMSPKAQSAMRDEARADVLGERDRVAADKQAQLDRVIAEKQATERQRDEALQIGREQVVPLLSQFVGTMTALIPLLQEIVRDMPSRRRRGDDEP